MAQLPPSSASSSASLGVDGNAGRCPPLNIVILLVGSRGDVQPFIAIAMALQKRGHRVRIGTHACFEEFVSAYGVDFYPLAGDPEILMNHMTRYPSLITFNPMEWMRQSSHLTAIYNSAWEACTMNADGTVFVPDVIVANPTVASHVHIAEKLQVPLHIMFTMPWTPTSQYESPCSPLPTWAGLDSSTSYVVVDHMHWWAFKGVLNDLRKRLGLRPLGNEGAQLLNALNIPHTYLWSPYLAPKPVDWGEHIDVTGFCDLPAKCPPPNPDLVRFLAAGSPPVYIGFGSVIMDDPASLSRKILKAVRKAGVRAVIHSGWMRLCSHLLSPQASAAMFPSTSGLPVCDSDESVSTSPAPPATVTSDLNARPNSTNNPAVVRENGPAENSIQRVLPMSPATFLATNLFILDGAVDHGWLFSKCCAVCHHGGAGTTYAGLKAGRPTIVVPFFGDQSLWGQRVHEIGAGPEPIPFQTLTASKLAAAIRYCAMESVVSAAAKAAQELALEDGVAGAVEAFERKLPFRDGRWAVSTYQVQRLKVGKGWSSSHLKESDPPEFTDMPTVASRSMPREGFPLPVKWRWTGDWMVASPSPRTSSPASPNDAVSSSSADAPIDPEGWEYAIEFTTSEFHIQCLPTDRVRRRRWVRYRIFEGQNSAKPNPLSSGASVETPLPPIPSSPSIDYYQLYVCIHSVEVCKAGPPSCCSLFWPFGVHTKRPRDCYAFCEATLLRKNGSKVSPTQQTRTVIGSTAEGEGWRWNDTKYFAIQRFENADRVVVRCFLQHTFRSYLLGMVEIPLETILAQQTSQSGYKEDLWLDLNPHPVSSSSPRHSTSSSARNCFGCCCRSSRTSSPSSPRCPQCCCVCCCGSSARGETDRSRIRLMLHTTRAKPFVMGNSPPILPPTLTRDRLRVHTHSFRRTRTGSSNSSDDVGEEEVEEDETDGEETDSLIDRNEATEGGQRGRAVEERKGRVARRRRRSRRGRGGEPLNDERGALPWVGHGEVLPISIGMPW